MVGKNICDFLVFSAIYSVTINIVERSMEKITKRNGLYYVDLKHKFNFSKISFDNIKTKALSGSGINLICNNEVYIENTINLYLASIIIK